MRLFEIRFPMSSLCIALAMSASVPAIAKPPAGLTSFKVGKQVFSGTPKTVCVIEGKWIDGEPFRYETWDSCREMTMRRATAAEYAGQRPRGSNKSVTVADIPPKGEVFEISNDFSSVLVFRDRAGVQREILIRD